MIRPSLFAFGHALQNIFIENRVNEEDYVSRVLAYALQSAIAASCRGVFEMLEEGGGRWQEGRRRTRTRRRSFDGHGK